MIKIQNGAGLFFIISIIVLSVVSIFGVWDILDSDVISKSFQTLGLLAVVAAIVIIAGNYIENKDTQTDSNSSILWGPVFKSIRKITITTFIISASLLAFIGVLVIWDILENRDTLHKSISSIVILGFASLLIVYTCLNREGNTILGKNMNLSIGSVAVFIILGFILLLFKDFLFGW